MWPEKLYSWDVYFNPFEYSSIWVIQGTYLFPKQSSNNTDPPDRLGKRWYAGSKVETAITTCIPHSVSYRNLENNAFSHFAAYSSSTMTSPELQSNVVACVSIFLTLESSALPIQWWEHKLQPFLLSMPTCRYRSMTKTKWIRQE